METGKGKRKKEKPDKQRTGVADPSSSDVTPPDTSPVTSAHPAAGSPPGDRRQEKVEHKGHNLPLAEAVVSMPENTNRTHGAQRFEVTSAEEAGASGEPPRFSGWEFDNSDFESVVSEYATLPRGGGRGRGRKKTTAGGRRGSQAAHSDTETDTRATSSSLKKSKKQQDVKSDTEDTTPHGSKSRSRSGSRKRLSRFFRRKSRGEGEMKPENETPAATKRRSRSETDLAGRRRSKDIRRQSTRRCDSAVDIGSSRDFDEPTWTHNPRAKLQRMTVSEAARQRRLRRTSSGSRLPVSGDLEREDSTLPRKASADKASLSRSLPDITLSPADPSPEEGGKSEQLEPEAVPKKEDLLLADTAFPRQKTRKSFRDKFKIFQSGDKTKSGKDNDKSKDKDISKDKEKKKDEDDKDKDKDKDKSKEKEKAKSKSKEKSSWKGKKSKKDKDKSTDATAEDKDEPQGVADGENKEENGPQATNPEPVGDVPLQNNTESTEAVPKEEVPASSDVAAAETTVPDSKKEKGDKKEEKKRAKELEKAKEKERKEMEKKEKEAREREKKEKKEQEKREKKKLKESRKAKSAAESSDSDEDEAGRPDSKKSRKQKKKLTKKGKKKAEAAAAPEAENVVEADPEETIQLDDSLPVPATYRFRDSTPTVESRFPWQRDVIETVGEVIVHSPAERSVPDSGPVVEEGDKTDTGELQAQEAAQDKPSTVDENPSAQDGSDSMEVSKYKDVPESRGEVIPKSSAVTPTLSAADSKNLKDSNAQDVLPALKIDETSDQIPQRDSLLNGPQHLSDAQDKGRETREPRSLSQKAIPSPLPASSVIPVSSSDLSPNPFTPTKTIASPSDTVSMPKTNSRRSLSRERTSSDSSSDIFYDAESEPEPDPFPTISKTPGGFSKQDGDTKPLSPVRKPGSLRLPSMASQPTRQITAGFCLDDQPVHLGDVKPTGKPLRKPVVPTIDVSPSEGEVEVGRTRWSVSPDPDSGVASPGMEGERSSQSPEPLVPLFDITKVRATKVDAGKPRGTEQDSSSRQLHPQRRSFRRQPKPQEPQSASSNETLTPSSPLSSPDSSYGGMMSSLSASDTSSKSSPLAPYRTRSLSPSVSALSTLSPQNGVLFSPEGSGRPRGRDSGISLSLDRGDNRMSSLSPDSVKTWSSDRPSPSTSTASSLLSSPTSPSSSLLPSPSTPTPSALVPSHHSHIDRSLSDGFGTGARPHMIPHSLSAVSDIRDYNESRLSLPGETEPPGGQSAGSEGLDAKGVPAMGTSVQQRYRRTFSPQRGRALLVRDFAPQEDQDFSEAAPAADYNQFSNGLDATSGLFVMPGRDVTLNNTASLPRDIRLANADQSQPSAMGKSASDPSNLGVVLRPKPEVTLTMMDNPAATVTPSRQAPPDDNDALLRAAIADSFEMARRGRESQNRRSNVRPSRSFRRKSPEEEAKIKAAEEEAARVAAEQKIMYDKSTQTSEIDLSEKAGKKKKEKKKKKDRENGVLGLMKKKKDRDVEEETTAAPIEEPTMEAVRALNSAEEPRMVDAEDGLPLLEDGKEGVAPQPGETKEEADDDKEYSDVEDEVPVQRPKKPGFRTLALLKQKFSRKKKEVQKNEANKAKEDEETFVFIENEVNLSKLAEIKETDILEDDIIEPLMSDPLPHKELRFQPLPPDEAVQKEEPLPPFTHTPGMRRRESTIREKRKEVVHCCKKFIAFLFSHIGLCSLVVGYTILGGIIFKAIEGPEEEALRSDIKTKRAALIEKLLSDAVELQLKKIGESNFSRSVELRLLQFQEDIHDATKNKGWDGKDEVEGQNNKDSQWSFASSLLYAITVMTTIGYGHVAPKTAQGRIVTIGYAVLGIPLTLLCLTNIGDVMATGFRLLYGKVCCGLCCKLFRPARRHRHPDLEKGLRRQVSRKISTPKTTITTIPTTATTATTNPSTSVSYSQESETAQDTQVLAAEAEEDKAKEVTHVPTSLCILLIAGYIFLGAILFALWEGWDFLTGSYFCFITLSTIGFGDIVPGMDLNAWSQQEKLVLCALYLVFGLSLIAMCFNLVQEDVKAKCRWLGMKMGIIDKPKAPDREARIQSQAIKSQSNNKLDTLSRGSGSSKKGSDQSKPKKRRALSFKVSRKRDPALKAEKRRASSVKERRRKGKSPSAEPETPSPTGIELVNG